MKYFCIEIDGVRGTLSPIDYKRLAIQDLNELIHKELEKENLDLEEIKKRIKRAKIIIFKVKELKQYSIQDEEEFIIW